MKFWNFRASNADERELFIDGVIAEESWWDDEVTPKQFKAELNSAGGDVVVRINSPGGDCVAASMIYTMLCEYSGKVTVKIDGLAASAASVIAMAGDKVLMSPTSMMMIHNPLTVAFGDHNEMEKAIQTLDEFKESIINAYELKTGLSRTVISHMMEDETWMNAKSAIEKGFADGMLFDPDEDDDKKKTENNVKAVVFASSLLERNIVNKIVEKIKDDSKESKAIPGEPDEAKQARKVELYRKNLNYKTRNFGG